MIKKREEKEEQKKGPLVQKSLSFGVEPSKETQGPSLKIWHWNVNGIRAVLNSKKFEEFINSGKH